MSGWRDKETYCLCVGLFVCLFACFWLVLCSQTNCLVENGSGDNHAPWLFEPHDFKR